MTPDELTAALRAAFTQCETTGIPLTDQQKQIMLDMVQRVVVNLFQDAASSDNPLDELLPEQRQAFLKFVESHSQENQAWKVKLLNDWLQGVDSGEIQFIRELYGVQWLDRIKPIHLAKYLESRSLQLKVGDRIEVSNNLWEWVQEDGPCSREWFPCTVVAIAQTSDKSNSLPASYQDYTSCTIRFDNGMEYEIQGMYEWNRYNWRWID